MCITSCYNGKSYRMNFLIRKYRQFENKYAKYARIFRYIVSGGTAGVTDIVFLYIFTEYIGLWYVLSAVLAYVIAFVVSFTLQKYWTFRSYSNEKVVSQGVAYFIVGLINLGLNTLLIYVFTDCIYIHYIISQIITSALIAVLSFFVYKKVIFRVR